MLKKVKMIGPKNRTYIGPKNGFIGTKIRT